MGQAPVLHRNARVRPRLVIYGPLRSKGCLLVPHRASVLGGLGGWVPEGPKNRLLRWLAAPGC